MTFLSLLTPALFTKNQPIKILPPPWLSVRPLFQPRHIFIGLSRDNIRTFSSRQVRLFDVRRFAMEENFTIMQRMAAVSPTFRSTHLQSQLCQCVLGLRYRGTAIGYFPHNIRSVPIEMTFLVVALATIPECIAYLGSNIPQLC